MTHNKLKIMAKSIFEQELKRKFKEIKQNELSEADKNASRMKMLEETFLTLGNKENRYIFFCPDIPLVNDLVRVVYDIAYTVKSLGFKVTILHETTGFKCKWLTEVDKKYNELDVEYIITTKSKKSKKQRNSYAFKPTDTVVVPDVFQEIFDNIYEVKLVQKVLLVTSYTGIGVLQPGVNYKQLGIETFIFLSEQLKEDYKIIFPDIQNAFVIEQPVDRKVFVPRIDKGVYPVITMSNVGNQKFAQQIINLFYNLYPNLSVFSFKFVDRNSYEEYVDSLRHAALHIILDDTLGFKKPLLESLQMNVPVITFERRELAKDTELIEFSVPFKREAFEIVEFLAKYCQYWLSNSTKVVTAEVEKVKADIKLDALTESSFETSVQQAFEAVQENRVKFFSSIKATIEKSANEQKEEA